MNGTTLGHGPRLLQPPCPLRNFFTTRCHREFDRLCRHVWKREGAERGVGAQRPLCPWARVPRRHLPFFWKTNEHNVVPALTSQSFPDRTSSQTAACLISCDALIRLRCSPSAKLQGSATILFAPKGVCDDRTSSPGPKEVRFQVQYRIVFWNPAQLHGVKSAIHCAFER